jgi:hypothetical protein
MMTGDHIVDRVRPMRAVPVTAAAPVGLALGEDRVID